MFAVIFLLQTWEFRRYKQRAIYTGYGANLKDILLLVRAVEVNCNFPKEGEMETGINTGNKMAAKLNQFLIYNTINVTFYSRKFYQYPQNIQ